MPITGIDVRWHKLDNPENPDDAYTICAPHEATMVSVYTVEDEIDFDPIDDFNAQDPHLEVKILQSVAKALKTITAQVATIKAEEAAP